VRLAGRLALAGANRCVRPAGVTWKSVIMQTRQRLAAYAVVFDDAGRVLLTREPDRRGRLGRWALPGGGVEHGEHPEQAVVREVQEETAVRVRVGALREVFSDITAAGRRRRVLHNVRLIYCAAVVSAEPGSPERRLSGYARWCAPQEWRTLSLAPFTARALDSDQG
jgi:8-oxo-dGTP diphosphatase